MKSSLPGSFEKSATVAALVVMWGLGIVMLWSRLLPAETLSRVDATTQSVMLTGAQVLGALFGVELAVLAITLQLHAQRDDEGAFMVRYVVQKHRALPIVGFTAGACGLTFAIPLAVECGLLLAKTPAVVVSALASTSAGLAGLWLLSVTVRDATSRTADLTQREFLGDIASAVEDDEQRIARIEETLHQLEGTGVQFNSWAPAISRDRWHEDFHVSVTGHVAGFRGEALSDLSSAVAPLISAKCEAFVTVLPGNTVGPGPVFVIVGPPAATKVPSWAGRGANADEGEDKSAVGLTVARRAEIEAALRKLIRRGRPSSERDDLNSFFERLGKRLVGYARRGDAPGLSTPLAILTEVVAKWCEIATTADAGLRSRMWRPIGQMFLGPLAVGLPEIIEGGIASGDVAVIRTLHEFMSDVARQSIHTGKPLLLRDIGGSVAFAYSRAQEHPGIREVSRRAVDAYLARVLLRTKPQTQAATTAEETVRLQALRLPLLTGALSTWLGCARHAIDRGLFEDLDWFIQRLMSLDDRPALLRSTKPLPLW